MKILLTVATLDPASGGPARSVPQLARALAAAGHEVGLWAPAAVDRLSDASLDDASELAVFSGPFAGALDAFGRPGLIHDNGIWLPCHREVAREAAKRGIPRIVSPRGMLEPWALNHKKWKKRLAWWLYQRRDLQSAVALHATAPPESEQFRKLGLKQPILLAANGVDLPITKHLEPSTKDQNPKVLLFLSRIHPKKGLPMLLEAWARLRPAGWRIVIVGPNEGGHVQELKQQCDKLGLAWANADAHDTKSASEAPEGQRPDIREQGMEPDASSISNLHHPPSKIQNPPFNIQHSKFNIQNPPSNIQHSTFKIQNPSFKIQHSTFKIQNPSFKIQHSKFKIQNPSFKIQHSKFKILFSPPLEGAAKWQAMQSADLFILPTHSENFGIAIAEAMAAGLPVITTHGAPWELLEQENCGWWVPVSTDAIADALADATRRSPEELAAMGAIGRKIVAERFSWDKIAGEMIACYEWLLGRGPRPGCVR
jgi:glycosyltransferase involved in cell wall biosynthesis